MRSGRSSSAPRSHTTTTVPPDPPPLERAPWTPGRASTRSTAAVAAGWPRPIASYPAWLAAITGPIASTSRRASASRTVRAAQVLLDAERGRRPHRIGLGGIDGGERVVGRAPAVEERPRRRALRGGRRPRRPGSSLTHGHACGDRVLDDALAHERGGARPAGTARRSRRARRRSARRPPRGRRAASTTGSTDAGRQRIGSTAPASTHGDDDLVHDPARRADHVVLRLLAQRREPERVDPRRRRARARSRPRARRSTTRRPTCGTSDDTESRAARRLDHAVADEHRARRRARSASSFGNDASAARISG